VSEVRNHRVIYKSMFPFFWRTSETHFVQSLATLVTAEELQDDQVLSAVPGIFQSYVDKLEELRVTIMGNTVFQASIKTDLHDWRGCRDRKFTKPQIPLGPEEIEKCLALMEKLGIVFGCFDLIRTPAGGLVFLEVNEMGQWLFVEEDIPEYPLLDAFSDFLISMDPKFVYVHSEKALRFRDSLKSELIREYAKNEGARHVERYDTIFTESTEPR
jgi:hypothetical protein